MNGTGKDIPSAAAVKATGERELAALDELLASVQPGESVHGARRRIKQLRSLMRLLRESLGEAAFARADAQLRAAANALAGSRRAEALVAAAARLEDGRPQPGFWAGLAGAHRDAHAAEGDPVAMLSQAREAIAAATREFAGASPAPGSDALIAESFLASYAKARRRLRAGLDSGAADALHAARKQVIHHLHQLKLLQPGRERRLASLEQLREMLGDLNDLDELEQLAHGMDVTAKDARSLAKTRARLLGRAGKAGQKLFRRRPGTFAKRLGHAGKPRTPPRPAALQAGE